MYIGNFAGLLEYDGACGTFTSYQINQQYFLWRLQQTEKFMRAGICELGYFAPDNLGKITFHSLLEFLPEDKRNLAQIWQCYVNNRKYITFLKLYFHLE